LNFPPRLRYTPGVSSAPPPIAATLPFPAARGHGKATNLATGGASNEKTHTHRKMVDLTNNNEILMGSKADL